MLDVAPAAIQEIIKVASLIRAEPGPDDEIVRGNQYVDEVELQQPRILNCTGEMTPVRCCRRSYFVQALCSKRESARFGRAYA
jgi:hypothetical protein